MAGEDQAGSPLLRDSQAGAIETRVVRDGVIRLDPPGLEAEAAEFFAIE
jgi:hypothetical protein